MQRGDRTIFVTGATGRQGHSACRYLREAGWNVKGLTRKPESPEAANLMAMGVKLVDGDLEEPSSFIQDLKGAYGVLAILTYVEGGPEAEMRQLRNLVDASVESDIQHFVYSSVSGADKKSGIPFFDSKQQNEVYIISREIPYTFLRPAHFMENFNIGPQCKSIRDGRLVFPLPPDRTLQMVAIDDIGFFSAMAFDRGDEMIGESYDLAGDELTMPEVAQRFSAHLGRDVEFVQLPMDELEKMDPEYPVMAQWLQDVGYKSDISSIRRMHPSLLSFDVWLSSGYWRGMGQKKKVMEGVQT